MFNRAAIISETNEENYTHKQQSNNNLHKFDQEFSATLKNVKFEKKKSIGKKSKKTKGSVLMPS